MWTFGLKCWFETSIFTLDGRWKPVGFASFGVVGMKLLIGACADGHACGWSVGQEKQVRYSLPKGDLLQELPKSAEGESAMPQAEMHARVVVEVEPARLSTDKWWSSEEVCLQHYFRSQHYYSARIVARGSPLLPGGACECLKQGVVSPISLSIVRGHVFELAAPERCML